MFESSRFFSLGTVLALFVSAGLLLVGCDRDGPTGIKPRQTGTDLGSSAKTAAAPQAGFQTQLNEVRVNTQQYKNLSLRDKEFEQFTLPVPKMGFHFVRKSLAKGQKTKTYAENWKEIYGDLSDKAHRRKPELLVYDTPTKRFPSGNRLVAVEYGIPFAGTKYDKDNKPNLFNDPKGLKVSEEHGWHVHPHINELLRPFGSNFSIAGACHYKGGPELYLLNEGRNDGADAILTVPFGKDVGNYGDDRVTAKDCPSDFPSKKKLSKPLERFAGNDFTVFHGKLWTLHTWVHLENPEGVFNPTNPRVQLK